VRKTFVDCCAVPARSILRSYGVRLDERDVSEHIVFKAEMRSSLARVRRRRAPTSVRRRPAPRACVLVAEGMLLGAGGSGHELEQENCRRNCREEISQIVRARVFLRAIGGFFSKC